MRWAPGRQVRHPFKRIAATGGKRLAGLERLPLGELEASASALLTVLLALLPARIAGGEAFCLEGLAELRVEDHQGAGDAELDGVGLTHDTTTLDGGDDVEGLFDAGDAEGTLRSGALLGGDEVDVALLLVDGELAAAGTQ